MLKSCVCLLLCFSSLQAQNPDDRKPTICLNMIVKNESKIIERCLNSVKDIIDYWVIVDTGSSDGTQNLIKETLKNIPGELHEKSWVNFCHNRNEALDFAKNKADYLLLIDADEKLILSPNFTKPLLNEDYYFIKFDDEGLEFSRVFLINMHRDWKWIGVIHEQLTSDTAKTFQYLSNITCKRHTSSSARSQDPQKYNKDAKLLEEALLQDPNNSRNVFYLAQSYLNAKNYELALQNYEKRMTMEGWDEEIFWSLLMVAKIQEILKFPQEAVINSYSKTFQHYPTRAEPLLHLSQYLIKNNQIVLAYALAKIAIGIPYPTAQGYIEPFVYDYASKYILACTAYELNKFEEATPLFQELLIKKNLPQALETAVQTSLSVCLKKK